MRPISKLLTLTATAALFSTLVALAQEPPAPSEPAAQPPAATPAAPAPEASTPGPEASTFTPAPAPAATVTVPARGSTMETVRSKFGSPTQEQPAIGLPPITRWDYPGYAVFFEHDKVLHTVLAAR